MAALTIRGTATVSSFEPTSPNRAGTEAVVREKRPGGLLGADGTLVFALRAWFDEQASRRSLSGRGERPRAPAR